MEKRFLIIKPSSLGDVLHAFPAVSALCRETGAVADWFIRAPFAPLLEYLPCVHNAIIFEREKLGSISSFPAAFIRMWKEVRREKYDAVIDLQGLLRSGIISLLAKSSVRAGFDAPREPSAGLFYTVRLPGGVPGRDDPQRHALLRNNDAVARFLGRSDIDFAFQMPVSMKNAASLHALIRKNGIPDAKRIIGVAPGARWITKEWPPEFFASVVNGLAQACPEAIFILTGSPSEKAVSAKIMGLAPLPGRIFDLTGQTALGELVELIRSCSLFLCNDSGPMHVAAALRVPVLACFGPTSPELTGPCSPASAVLRPEGLDCLCCMKRSCSTKKCQSSIEPELAVSAGLNLMKGNTR